MEYNIENNKLSQLQMAQYYSNAIERSMYNFGLNDTEKGLIKHAFGVTEEGGIIAKKMNDIISYDHSMKKLHNGSARLEPGNLDDNVRAGKDLFLYFSYNNLFKIDLNPDVDINIIKATFFHEVEHMIHMATILIRSENSTLGDVFDYFESDLFVFQTEFFSYLESQNSMISEIETEDDWKNKVFSHVESDGSNSTYERARRMAGSFEQLNIKMFNFLSEQIGQDPDRPIFFNLLPEANIIFQGVTNGIKKGLFESVDEDEFIMFFKIFDLALRQDTVENFFRVLTIDNINVGDEGDVYEWFAGQRSYKVFYNHIYDLKNL